MIIYFIYVTLCNTICSIHCVYNTFCILYPVECVIHSNTCNDYMLGYDITIKLMASCMPGVVLEDLCTFRALIVGFLLKIRCRKWKSWMWRNFSHEKCGVLFWVWVRKGKETSLCHQIFPNLEQYLSLPLALGYALPWERAWHPFPCLAISFPAA